MKILGLSCFYHDSAAALLVDGKLVAAAHEELLFWKRDLHLNLNGHRLAAEGVEGVLVEMLGR